MTGRPPGRLRRLGGSTFRSLRVRNYRLFFIGQLVSVSGTWTQTVAQGWLVLRLSGDSAVAVGVVTALQYLPLLVLGSWTGVVADRHEKRRILTFTQASMAVSAFAIGVLTLTDTATLGLVFALVFLGGVATAFDIPARQAFLIEMVPNDQVGNAVALNSAVFNASRVLGPALAGVLILTVGIGWCFIANAISYAGSIVALHRMRGDELMPAPATARAPGQVRAGLRYIAATPTLWSNLLLSTVVGLLALNFPVVLPVLAKATFEGDAGTYSAMTAAMGIGAMTGALTAAAQQKVGERTVLVSSLLYGAALCATALAPSIELVLVGLAVCGCTNIVLLSTANAIVHREARPEMRGRVHSVRAMAVVGTTPIGAPIAGFVTQVGGARWGLGMGGGATLLAAFAYGGLLRHQRQLPAVVPAGEPLPVAGGATVG